MEAVRKWDNESFGKLDSGGLEVVELQIGPSKENWLVTIEAHPAGTEIPGCRTPNVRREATRQRYPAELLHTFRRELQQAHPGGAGLRASSTEIQCRRKQALKNGIRLIARVFRDLAQTELFAVRVRFGERRIRADGSALDSYFSRPLPRPDMGG